MIIQDSPCVVYSERLNKTYTLYKTEVRLRPNSTQTIYYFSASKQREQNNMGYKIEPVAVPVGYRIVENPRNGFIRLKRDEVMNNRFLSGYSNTYNDSPYIEGYIDALCMIKQNIDDSIELNDAIEYLQKEII